MKFLKIWENYFFGFCEKKIFKFFKKLIKNFKKSF